jgi:hypothetical protein
MPRQEVNTHHGRIGWVSDPVSPRQWAAGACSRQVWRCPLWVRRVPIVASVNYSNVGSSPFATEVVQRRTMLKGQ